MIRNDFNINEFSQFDCLFGKKKNTNRKTTFSDLMKRRQMWTTHTNNISQSKLYGISYSISVSFTPFKQWNACSSATFLSSIKNDTKHLPYSIMPHTEEKTVQSSSGRHIIQDYDKNNHAFERIMRKWEFFFESRVKRTGLRGANYTRHMIWIFKKKM